MMGTCQVTCSVVVAHGELQEMADGMQRWNERVVVRRSGRARRVPERY